MSESPLLDDHAIHRSESDYSILSGGTSTFEASPIDSRPSTSPHDREHRLPDRQPPDPSVITSNSIPFRARPNYLHHTWAKTFYSRAEFLISPESVEEVQLIALLASRCRRRVVAVGSGHSPSDLACTSSWMVTLSNFTAILSVEKFPAESGPGAIPHMKRYGGRVLVQAGISLQNLNKALEQHDLTLPNLGSINIQSVAGAISTGTHGSSLQHGLLSQNVRGLRIVLADGSAKWCSADENSDLFRAALVSLGGLGIVTEIQMDVAPACDIEWEQGTTSVQKMLDQWDEDLWTSSEYVRCWWMPYTKRVVVWKADKTTAPRSKPKGSWYGGAFGFHSYHIMLWAAIYFPSLLPRIEWLVMGMQYGFSEGKSNSAVQSQQSGLLMDCLFSQFVNEWAIPLERGPEAIIRLQAWLHGDTATARIPFNHEKLYIHAPIEVRVTDSSKHSTNPRAFLDPTHSEGPTLYLNATLYRPYGLDPPCRERYYEAFEWLMKEMGGRPHWAKNFATITNKQIKNMYGAEMDSWLGVRGQVDPDGMFMGAWHRRLILGGAEEGSGVTASTVTVGQDGKEEAFEKEEKLDTCAPMPLRLEERERGRQQRRWKGGVDWFGEQASLKSTKEGGIELIDDEVLDDDIEDLGLLERLKREAVNA